MPVYKALVDLTYYPDGPAKPVQVKAGDLIHLRDEIKGPKGEVLTGSHDYLVGTQIHPQQVQKIDPEVMAKAVEAATAAEAKVIDKATEK